MIYENRKIKYLTPVRIVAMEGDIKNADCLLKECDNQIAIYEPDCFEIKGEGFIVLDFGEEQAGGIRILSNIFSTTNEICKLRIRFGESVSETYSTVGEHGATNDHAIRDMEVTTISLSDQSFGDTGFRFVRIDFLNSKDFVTKIKSILAKCWYNDFELKESFSCKDERINQIFNICKHTLDLCIQNNIWDGIKRDRLVWIGDMEPEIHSILHIYGNIKQVESSICSAENHNPLPGWMNGIPSYSMWYLLINAEVLEFSKDKAYFDRHKPYADRVIKLLNKAITNEGSLDFTKVDECPSNSYFIDWPGNHGSDQERIDANKNLLIYVLRNYIRILSSYNYDVSLEKDMLNRLESTPTATPKLSQFAAFHYLVNKDDASYEVLIKNGANGLTTFMSYFILTAIADRDFPLAVSIMKQYYSGMIDRGATSFWEDFSLSWLEGSSRIDELPKEGEKDLHGDYGEFCYTQFRHSLCHGWSSGPISFLLENKEKLN